MRRLLVCVGAAALLSAGCTEADVAELDSASICLEAASANLDAIEAKQMGHSGAADLAAKARELDAKCDAAKRKEFDIKTGGG